MGKMIRLIEEVAMDQGYTEEEIKTTIWNSPPTEKWRGRYLVMGKTIDPKDFTTMKAKNLIWYWDEEFLDEMDMWSFSPGWRMDANGIFYLSKIGYTFEINTLKMQTEKREKAEKEAEEKRISKAIKEKEDDQRFKQEVQDFEIWLGSPKWRQRKENEGQGDHLKTLSHGSEKDHYNQYSVMPDGRVFFHQHINFDWWNNLTSETPAPAYIIEEAQRIKTERQTEEQRRQKEWHEKKKDEDDFIRPFILASVERAGGWASLQSNLKKSKQINFCPRELHEKYPGKYSFTIQEAKKICGLTQ